MTIPTIGFSDNTLATDDVPDLHHFAVLATDSAGDTYLSNIQTADYSVPRYPADLAAAALADGNIGVTWSNSAFNESGGILKRSSDGGTTWTTVASLSTDQTWFQDTSATPAVDYIYEVEYTRTNDAGLAESGYDVMTTPVTPLAGKNSIAAGNITVAHGGSGSLVVSEVTPAGRIERGVRFSLGPVTNSSGTTISSITFGSAGTKNLYTTYTVTVTSGTPAGDYTVEVSDADDSSIKKKVTIHVN